MKHPCLTGISFVTQRFVLYLIASHVCIINKLHFRINYTIVYKNNQLDCLTFLIPDETDEGVGDLRRLEGTEKPKSEMGY
jgi:hypothetical protein